MTCLLNAAKTHFNLTISTHSLKNREERMKDKELTHTLNQIRDDLGDMWKSKIIYNIPYMTINLAKVSEAYLAHNQTSLMKLIKKLYIILAKIPPS